MAGGERRGIETQLGQRAGPEVFDQHVRPRDQPLQDRPPFGVLEIEGQAFLVAVDAEEVRAFFVQKRRAPGPGVVALARLLDLDDARAHVAQQHRAVRTRQHPRQVQDKDAVKRGHWLNYTRPSSHARSSRSHARVAPAT